MIKPRWLPVTLLGVIVALTGAGLLFSTFMMYDDEGYVLFSLKTFTELGGLYVRVFSQYGPFFFLFHQGLHLVGFEFNSTGARLLTLVFWLGTCGFSAALVWRLTRSQAATVFTLGGTFLHLWPMISEPSHPGGLIAFVIAAAAWAGVRWIDQPGKLAALAGAAGAALLLTKINIGVFFIAGAGAWWWLHLDEKFFGARTRAVIAGLAMAALPFALMNGQLKTDSILTFAIVVAAGSAAAVIAAACGAAPRTQWKNLQSLGFAAAAVAIVTFGTMLAEGSSPHALLEGWLLNPLRFPQVYAANMNWRASTVPLALGSLALAAWFAARPPAFAKHVVAAGRVLALVVYFLSWVATWSLNTHAFALSYGLSAVWLFVMPLDGDRTTQPARAWLALLLLPQALHAFPVAGSQISWGTFLWIPLAVVGVHDVVRVFAASWPPARQRLLALAGAALVLVTTVRCANYGWVAITRLRASDSLRLPGASGLRLPESFTTMLRILSRNVSAHSDVLFSVPGMLSFHLWTDVPPPTSLNATHWFTLLSPAQQEAIRVRLEASPRSCVIMQRNIYEFLVRVGVATESPLNLWLKANYEPAFTLETYEFWVRKGRHIAAIGTADLFEGTPGTTPRYKVSLTLAESALRDVAGVELRRFDIDISSPVVTWTAANSHLVVTPLLSTGAAAGPARNATFPFEVNGLVRLDVLIDKFPPGCPLGSCVLYLLNAAGERVAEARFVN